MERLRVIEAFNDDDGDGREVRRAIGDEFSATNDRAEELRERDFVKKAPEAKKDTEAVAEKKAAKVEDTGAAS